MSILPWPRPRKRSKERQYKRLLGPHRLRVDFPDEPPVFINVRDGMDATQQVTAMCFPAPSKRPDKVTLIATDGGEHDVHFAVYDKYTCASISLHFTLWAIEEKMNLTTTGSTIISEK
jgi:hypothetical protein